MEFFQRIKCQSIAREDQLGKVNILLENQQIKAIKNEGLMI